jgi:hypothetical protein
MSFEPPKTESSRRIPGIVFPLAFVSIILLGAVLVFGALAFDVNIPGRSNPETEFAAPEEALESSGFVMRERSIEGATTIAKVEVSVINTSDLPVDAFEMLVQCDDGGYVSAIQAVSGIEAGANRTVAMELSGRGEPNCHEPIIEFSASNPGD